MHGVAGDEMSRHVEFLLQLLHRGDLVGFFIDFDMSQNQRRIDRDRAEQLPRLDVVEGVETGLERLAVERNNARLAAHGGEIQVRGVFAKYHFDIRRAQPLQNIADGRMRRWPFPFDFEGFVQLLPMHLGVRANASIRIGPAN